MKALKSFASGAIAVLLLGVCIAHAGEIGELDTTFGEDGKVITTFGEFGDQAYAVALQADGKIVAAGSSSNGIDLDLAIARYNEDGTLDTSFNVGGKLRTSLGEGDEEITAIAVQDDGYIVAAGYTVIAGGRDFMLVRLTPDGEFDNSFGEGGVVVTEFGNQHDEITAIALDEEERIVACGYVTGTAGLVVAVARYKTSGVLDDTFGDGGVVLIDIGDDALARSVDIDEQGRILVTGTSLHADSTELMVLRFHGDGKLDKEFGQDGIGLPANRELPSEGYGISLTGEGLILVAGSVGKGEDLDTAVFRFTESGQPDTSFGDNGVLVTAAGKEDDMALSIDVIDNVVGMSGFSRFNTKRDFLFVSLEETEKAGTNVALNLKTGGFSSGGKTYGSVFDLAGRQLESGDESGDGEKTVDSVFSTTSLGYTDDVSFAVVLQPDGKAVSAGFSEQDGVTSFAVARYITPVANSAGGAVDTAVAWIQTREPFDVNRTGAITGGTIFASGVTVTQRGVVYSTAPYPVYDADDTSDAGNGSGGSGGGNTDTTAPVISNGSPTGELASGTIDTTMAVNTNENATCKYATSTGTDYDSMANTFSNTGAKSHSEPISSLEDGKNYTYYVRCRDEAKNKNTKDYAVSFSVRIGPNILDSAPTGQLPAGTADETLQVTTDVDATCKYSITAGTDYDAMIDTFVTTGGKSHSQPISGLSNGESYTYYVRCRNGANVTNTTDYTISFSVAAARFSDPPQTSTLHTSPLQVVSGHVSLDDLSLNDVSANDVSANDASAIPETSSQESAPEASQLLVSNGSPRGVIASGSTMTYIGVYSSEQSTCRYSTQTGQDFDSMPEEMATADNISHIAKIDGLVDDHTYTYYIVCRDFAGNENAKPYNLSFRVAAEGDYAVQTYRRIRDAFGRFLVAPAYAQDISGSSSSATGSEDDTPDDKPSSVFDLTAPAYSEKGSTDDGGGTGSYSSVLKNLKPGTFYYVRAYALDSSGKVYYGNQVGFKTADSCFIATAAYGTLLHPYVKVLRSFRDRYLTTNAIGRGLVEMYYRYSPPAADYIAARPFVRGVVQVALLPVVGTGWLVLHIGFAGLALIALFIITPSVLLFRSYRRLEIE